MFYIFPAHSPCCLCLDLTVVVVFFLREARLERENVEHKNGNREGAKEGKLFPRVLRGYLAQFGERP